MSFLVHTLLLLIYMLASALFSGLETGGYLLNRLMLRYRARHRDRAALRLQSLLKDAHLFIFTVLIGNNIAIYLLSRHVTKLYLNSGIFSDKTSLILSAGNAATLTLMLPLFLFAELLPKKVFRSRADILMYRFSGLLAFFQVLFRPFSLCLKMIFHLLTAGRIRAGALSVLSLSIEGLREFFADESTPRPLTSHQHGMIDNLIEMHRLTVSRVMKPLTAVDSVSDRATVRDVLRLMSENPSAQVLVMRRGGRSFCGMAHLGDLTASGIQLDDPVRPLCRKPVRLSPSNSLSEAFKRLQKGHDGCGVVVDRSSRVIGLLRTRDLAAYIASGS
jgi:CBS domain containing-hemolysin-like protein